MNTLRLRAFVLPLFAFLVAAAMGAGSDREAALRVADPGPGGASKLTLAPGLSFTDDSSRSFPIRGEGLSDGRIASDRPTLVFFGTSHCWNTNREAERFVAFSAKVGDSIRFLVVDLEHPSAEQKPLVKRLFHGYIPTIACLDRDGSVVYDRSGETARERGDLSGLEQIVLKSKAP
jgi:hypothetical protein